MKAAVILGRGIASTLVMRLPRRPLLAASWSGTTLFAKGNMITAIHSIGGPQ